MDEAEFEKTFGRPPRQDDLHRVNCTTAGAIGHMMCGICEGCQRPRFECMGISDKCIVGRVRELVDQDQRHTHASDHPRSARKAPATGPARYELREIIDFDVFFEGDDRTPEERQEEIERLRACWDQELPHFEGTSPHRYEDSWPYCVYCGRPKYYLPPPTGTVSVPELRIPADMRVPDELSEGKELLTMYRALTTVVARVDLARAVLARIESLERGKEPPEAIVEKIKQQLALVSASGAHVKT